MIRKIALLTVLLVLTLSIPAVGTPPVIVDNQQLGLDVPVVYIGANLELTGNIGNYGKMTLNGIQMAAEEINSKGGVLGVPLKIIVGDNRSDDPMAKKVTESLIAYKKFAAIIGTVTSRNFTAAIPVASQNKIPLITPSATQNVCTVDEAGTVRPYAFRVPLEDSYQGIIAAKFAIRSIKAKTASVFYDNDSSFSIERANSFAASFTEDGGTVISTDSYVSYEDNFFEKIKGIIAKNPDVLFVPAHYRQGGEIVKTARGLGYTNPIVGGEGLASSVLEDLPGENALHNVYCVDQYHPDDKDPISSEFVKRYKLKYGDVPDTLAAHGYDTVYLIADAIKRAQSADPEKVRDALAGTNGFVGVTGSITMDNNHNPIKPAVIISIDKGGQLVFKERINP